jgi:hypothetical protein
VLVSIATETADVRTSTIGSGEVDIATRRSDGMAAAWYITADASRATTLRVDPSWTLRS